MRAEATLKEYFVEYGTLIELPINYRLFLHDDGHFLWIEEGDVDLFALEPSLEHVESFKVDFERMAQSSQPFLGNSIHGSLNFLHNAQTGALLLEFASHFRMAKPLIIAIANGASKIRKLSIMRLKELLEGQRSPINELDIHIQQWIENLSPIFLYHPPPSYLFPLEINRTLLLNQDHAFEPVKTEEEKIVWIQIEEGAIEIAGLQTLTLKKGDFFYPLALSSWFQPSSDTSLVARHMHAILFNPSCLQGLNLFHEQLIDVLFFNKLLKKKKELNKMRLQMTSDDWALTQSFDQLGRLFSQEELIFPLIGANRVYRACQLVGNALNLRFTPLPNEQVRQFPTVEEYLYHLCLYSDVHYRRVTLIEDWWTHELGPLLCFKGEEKFPLALLPLPKGGYEAVHSETEERKIFDPDQFPDIRLEAYLFYRVFPDKAILLPRDVIRFALRGKFHEYGTLIFFTFLIVSLLAVIPTLTSQLFGVVIPNLDYPLFTEIGLGLGLIIFSILIFTLSREYVAIRLQTLFDENVSCAIWARILQLPIQFFRKYSPVDLFNRLQFVSHIRMLFGGTALRQMMTAIFSIIYLIPMFYYHSSLAWIGLGFVGAGILVPFFSIFFRVNLMRQQLELSSSLQDRAMQILLGINAIRTYGCENRFFSNWEKLFSENKQLEWRLIGVQNAITTVGTLTVPLSLMAIYTYMVYEHTQHSIEGGFELGDFMGFYFSYLAFSAALSAISGLATEFSSIFPLWERTKLFLRTSPDRGSIHARSSELKGEVRVDRLCFRYDREEASCILKDISLEVKPSEFIGIVGASGCGKSTLLRLLIGFETPESGAIYYDGRDLSTLDVQKVRRQMGIVLQSSAILDGTIRDNVMVGGIYSDVEILHALTLSGFAQDLSTMPMGLNTLLMNGGTTLSGGQRQRILIARALIGNPKVLIFDEATSALDNQTQEWVSQNLERLNTTRIVIAHRLSTIRKADRIYVMDQGRIVDSGTFKELSSRKGLVADTISSKISL